MRPALGLRPWFAFDRRALARRLLVRLDMAVHATAGLRRTGPIAATDNAWPVEDLLAWTTGHSQA